MARFPVAAGGSTAAGQGNQLTVLVDTQGKRKGIILQNVSTVDIYVSENPNQLQNASAANLPSVGLHFPPDSIPPWQLVLPSFNGKLYARAQGLGGAMEAIEYDAC